MTRPTGQISALQAVLGGLVIVVFAGGVIAALDLLVPRTGLRPPLTAPAQDESDDLCPQPVGGAPAAPITVTAGELIACPRSFDGAPVRFQGEAVRAILRRGARAWVHLNDDPYALDLGPLPEHRTTVGGNSGMPVSIPVAVADDIAHVGDGHHRGDIIAVTGTFHRADPADGGGPTIQAESAQITRSGSITTRSVYPARVVTAGIIGIAVLAVTLGSYRTRIAGSRPPTDARPPFPG